VYLESGHGVLDLLYTDHKSIGYWSRRLCRMPKIYKYRKMVQMWSNIVGRYERYEYVHFDEVSDIALNGSYDIHNPAVRYRSLHTYSIQRRHVDHQSGPMSFKPSIHRTKRSYVRLSKTSRGHNTRTDNTVRCITAYPDFQTSMGVDELNAMRG
jgi:hypothetical protein